jgi:hypothetical protein
MTDTVRWWLTVCLLLLSLGALSRAPRVPPERRWLELAVAIFAFAVAIYIAILQLLG